MRVRVVFLLVAGLLLAGAVVARVWLAATRGYSDGALSLPLRVASAIALFAGFLLAGAVVVWPMDKPIARSDPDAAFLPGNTTREVGDGG